MVFLFRTFYLRELYNHVLITSQSYKVSGLVYALIYVRCPTRSFPLAVPFLSCHSQPATNLPNLD